MTVRNRKVYSIVNENKVLEKSIISHTSYAKNGYVITHFSMDAKTMSSPERLSTPALVIATSGTIQMTIFDQERKIIKVLKEGQSYLRPANCFAYYKAEQDKAIATEVKVRNSSVITEVLKEDRIFDLDQLVEYDPNHWVSHYLIKDDKFCMKVKSFSELTKDEGVSDISFVITLLEGSVNIKLKEKEYCLNPHQSLIVDKKEAYSVICGPKTKVVLVYFED